MRCALCDKVMEPHEIKFDKVRKVFLDCPKCRTEVFYVNQGFSDTPKDTLTTKDLSHDLGIDTL